MTFIAQYYYNVAHPEIGPEQSFRFQVNYAIPERISVDNRMCRDNDPNDKTINEQ